MDEKLNDIEEQWLPIPNPGPKTGRIPIDELRAVKQTNPADTYRFDALMDFSSHRDTPFSVTITGSFEGPNSSRPLNVSASYPTSPSDGGRYWVAIGSAVWQFNETLEPTVTSYCVDEPPLAVPFPMRARPSRSEASLPDWTLDNLLDAQDNGTKTGRIPIDDLLVYVQIGNAYEFDVTLDFSDHRNSPYELWAEALFTPQQQETPSRPEKWTLPTQTSTVESCVVPLKRDVIWHSGNRLDLKVFTRCLQTGMIAERMFSAVRRATEPRPPTPPSHDC